MTTDYTWHCEFQEVILAKRKQASGESTVGLFMAFIWGITPIDLREI
jgi:hypothetical protein